MRNSFYFHIGRPVGYHYGGRCLEARIRGDMPRSEIMSPCAAAPRQWAIHLRGNAAMTSATKTTNERALSPAVAHAVRFTEVYRDHRHDHPAVREAACLKAQFPAMLSPVEPGDMFAGGHIRDRMVYVGTIWWAMMPDKCGPGKQGGYCFDFAAAEKFARTDADRDTIDELERFWGREATWVKIYDTWDDDMRRRARRGAPVNGAGSGFVLALELDRLLQAGIPGMAQAVARRVEATRRGGETDTIDFLHGLQAAVDVLTDVCRHYERQARAMASDAISHDDEMRLGRIADALAALLIRPPHTLFEAIQLWWLYSVMACGLHIEGWRIDEALGDFYAADIDSGRLTEAQAIEQVCGLWRMFAKHSDPAVSRAIVGGRGRRNERNADRFAMAAMEATRRLRQVIPQLTLRMYDGQDPALVRKAYDVIGEGSTYPMLYNDDVNVPGVAAALSLSETEAERYYPLGCGEYMVGGASPSLLLIGWSVPKTVEAALFKEDGSAGRADFESYERLWDAVCERIARDAQLAARIHEKSAAYIPGECAFLLGSLLTLDCVERGAGILDGGARYNGACIMGHGFTNAADGLAAIKKYVWEDGKGTLAEVRDALRANFEGHQRLRRNLAAAPKFGNDNDGVDTILVRLWREISRNAAKAGEAAGLDFLTVSSVNPGGYFMGAECGATPDGRLAGEPFAIGNAPTAGADTHGITALLNSISKVDPRNGGATTNVKLAKSLFSANRPQLEALFSAFWRRGGMQATLTVVDQAELERAMEQPAKYPHLLVRVGGWTARFIDLEEQIQRDIIRRTMY